MCTCTQILKHTNSHPHTHRAHIQCIYTSSNSDVISTYIYFLSMWSNNLTGSLSDVSVCSSYWLLPWKPTGESSHVVRMCCKVSQSTLEQLNVTRSCSVLSSVENEGGLQFSESMSFSSVVLCSKLSTSSKAPSTPTLSS